MTSQPPSGDLPDQNGSGHGPSDDRVGEPIDESVDPAVERSQIDDSELPTGPIDPAALRAAAAQDEPVRRRLATPIWALIGAGAVTLVVVAAIIASTAGSAGPTVTGSVQGAGGSIPAGTTTSGVPGASTTTTSGTAGSSSAPATPVAALSLTPADFPSGYTATAVPPRDLPNVLTDIAGSASNGTTVTPSGCAPAALPSDPADASVLVATTEAGTLTVATVRVAGDLTQHAVNPCSHYTINELGAIAKVSTTMLPPSPVESDASVAFRRVRNTGSGANLKQTTTLLVAQNGPIRVYATYLAFGDHKLDGQALDQVFTKAVQKSRG